MKLYELTGQYLQLEELMEDPDVDPEILADTREALDGDFSEKLENCGKILKNFTANQEAIDEEIKRLQAKKKTLTNREESFKKYIKSCMQALNKKKERTPLFLFSIREGSDSVVIDTEEDVPDEFRIKVPDKIDKEGIKKALKDGKKFDFAHLQKGEPSLLIK